MISPKDVKQLVKAHQKIHAALQAPDRTLTQRVFNPLQVSPGKAAARVLCRELSWLVNTNTQFWKSLDEASSRLRVHKRNEGEYLKNIEQLLKDEEDIFHRLGVTPDESATVLSNAYGALRIARNMPDPTPDALGNLRDRLKKVAELVCGASRGPLQRAFGKLVSRKGAGIVAGAAVAGGNIAISIMDQGTLSWVSLKVGYHVMRGEYEELLEIFKSDDSDISI
jgi:hypothetical protein